MKQDVVNKGRPKFFCQYLPPPLLLRTSFIDDLIDEIIGYLDFIGCGVYAQGRIKSTREPGLS